MNAYKKRALELKDEIIRDRRHIHRSAETGMSLPATVEYVCARLRECGIEPRLLGGGVTATVGVPGKVILLRADMDALVQAETSGSPFACPSGTACHSCGHDCHTAMLLAAAKMLKEREKHLCGTVKFMFQPGEEILEGAQAMLDAGILEAPAPDAAMAIHIHFGPGLYTDAASGDPVPCSSGTMVMALGAATQSGDEFHIMVIGRPCHGSSPCDGVSALSAGAAIVSALQQLVPMEVSSREAAVISMGSFHSGTAANIIPGRAEITGTIRTFSPEVRAFLKKRLGETAVGVAAALRAEAKVEYAAEVGPVINDPAFTRELRGYAEETCSGTRVVLPSPGSEDFARICERVPQAALIDLCVGSAAEGYIYPGHDPRMTIDEGALPCGAAAYANCAEKWLAARE